MIALLEDKTIIAPLCGNDIFGTRIYADYLSGAAELIWWDKKELILCLKSGIMTFCGKISDPGELKEFASVISPQAIMCHYDTAEHLELKIIQSGVIMSKNTPGKNTVLQGYYPDVLFSDYHELLEKCDMAPDYAGFCLETSRALKTGTGILLEHREGKRLISALVAASVTEYSAIINAVAVDPEFQRQGYGRKLLQEAESKLSGRQLYIMREENKNEKFYTSCGYVNSGCWCVAEI